MTSRCRFHLPCAALGLALAAWSPVSRADVDARRLFRSFGEQPSGVHRALGLAQDQLALTAELPPGSHATERGLTPIAGRVAVARGSYAQLRALVAQNPDVHFRWSPPFRPQLDRVDGWTRASQAREATGLTGAGVVVGVIDTGADTKHPALRNADGTTRIRWLIDFGQEPLGLHPELEESYGCTGDRACAVLAAADIDARLQNATSGDEPSDPIGHGTHVASLAAGNGAPDGVYRGTAPEADLIVAQVGSPPSGAIFDVNILTAARFVFERAEELGRPAVINISLGSNFGAHDGSSALEQGLASLLGAPGRAIVTAAGNSAGQYLNLSPHYPGPFGIHTEVHVAQAGETRVPLLAPAVTTRPVRGAIFAWIASAPGDSLSVGFSNGREGKTEFVPRGRVGGFSSDQLGDDDDYVVSIINGVRDNAQEVPVSNHGAVVIIAGEWRAGRTFSLRFEGNGTARIWVDSSGDLDPSSSPGAMVPASFKAGTVSVPASHPELIAVGATTNRSEWMDHTGALVRQKSHGALEDAPGDTTAFFSGAGPTSTGWLKPDLVAPGVHVIGAMSAEADPRVPGNGASQFSSLGMCGTTGGECLVVNDDYALASGTSMAAPVVTGAVALLLQRDPTLTQTRIRHLLQAGSRAVAGTIFAPEQTGAGALDVVGALRAQDAAAGPTVEPTTARIQLARSFVPPDPATPLEGLVLLRGGDDEPAQGFAMDRLAVDAPGAAAVSLVPLAEGLWRLSVAMPRGSGGRRVGLRVTYDGRVLAERSVPVAVDPHVAPSGFRTSGGCGVAHVPNSLASGTGAGLVVLVGLTLLGVRRRRGSLARGA